MVGFMTWNQQRVSFGQQAATYDRLRPDWPAPTVRWLTGTEIGSGRESDRLDVLDLGAGTGKLTRTLVELGHRTTAVEPSPGMLGVLAQALPQVPAIEASAERIPLPDNSFDVVTVAQAWHWFRHPEAEREIARVLRPGGLLAVAWHERDVSVPWVAQLSATAGVPDWSRHNQPGGPVHTGDTVVALPDPFGPPEQATFAYTLELPLASLPDLASSWSYVSTRPDREATLERIRRLGEQVAAGQDDPRTLRLPHITRCHRARVVAASGRGEDGVPGAAV